MRVAFVTTSFPRSEVDDSAIFVSRLVGALEAHGVKGVTVVPRDADEDYQPYKDILTIRIGYTLFQPRMLAFGAGILPNIRMNPLAVLQIPGLLFSFAWALFQHRKEYQLIHANWLATCLPAALIGALVRKPFIVTVRGEDLRMLRLRLVRILLWPFISRSRAVVVVGQSLKLELLGLLPALNVRTFVVENGVEPPAITAQMLAEVRAQYSLPENRRYIIFVGSIIPRKRVAEAIRIFSKIYNDNVDLLLCGRLDDTDYVRECRQIVDECNLGERVRFLGKIPPKSVWGLLALSTLYLTASEFEGRPNAVLEALSVGLPVVARSIPAHVNVVSHDQSGYLYSSEEEASAALNRFIGDQGTLDQMSAYSKESMLNKGWSDVAMNYLELYRLALEIAA